MLSQIQYRHKRPVAYFIDTLSPKEKNYCVTQNELLTVVKALVQSCPYLCRWEFRLLTDHERLT